MNEEIVLEPLHLEEMIAQDSSVETSFVYEKGVWWRRIRRGFFQPAFVHTPVCPADSSPPVRKAFIGYHHLVPEESQANSRYIMLVNSNVKDYSIDRLPDSIRRNVKKALRTVEIRKIADVNDILASGYETYLSFIARTGWGAEWKNRDVFEEWARKAFGLKKRFFLGVYLEDRLIAFSQPYTVNGVAFVALLISHTDYQTYRPNDLIMHTILTACRNTPGVHSLNFGPRSLKPSLDRFKMKFGLKAAEYPAYAWINPLLKPVVKKFYPGKYSQLMGGIIEENGDGKPGATAQGHDGKR